MAPQTINWPAIEAVEVAGLDSAQAQTINWPHIKRGKVFAPLVLRESDLTAGLVVEVNGTPLEGTFARSFEEQLADTGSFSFQMLRADFLPTPPVVFDDLVTMRLDGQAVFLGVVEQIEHVALAQGEGAEQTVTIGGRGALALLDQTVVSPSRGVGKLPIEDVRTLSWVGVDFDPEEAAWPVAKIVNYVSNYADTGAPRPYVFPNINGTWIWGNVPGVTALDAPQGINLFRTTFTASGVGPRRFFFAGDNVMRLWIDGSEITWFAGSANGRYADVELSAGDHVIAAKVANKVDVPGEDNPAGFIFAGYRLSTDGLLGALEVETDATWRVLPYPVRAPGFTDGKAQRLLFDEAALEWEFDFDDLTDTAGQTWEYQREISVTVGRTYLDVLRERMDAYVDAWVAPGSPPEAPILRMTNRGGRGTVRSVTLQQTGDPATSDFLALSHSGKRTRMNVALVRYAEGHLQTYDEESFAEFGARYGYLELGAVVGETEAIEIATAIMEFRKAPAYSTSATIFPRSDATTPYKGFEVGDYLTCPNEDDDPEVMRVNSIAYTEDDEGEVSWAVTLRDKQQALEERHDTWLRRMADGTAVGGARVSSRAGTPAPTASQITVLQVAEFSYDNTALTVSTSPRRPADQSGNIVQVYGELTTAGTTTTTVLVNLNGSTIATLTFPAGVTETSVQLDALPVHANVDKLQVQITAAGDDAAGLDVQVRAI